MNMMFMHDSDPYGSFPLEPLPSVPVGGDKTMTPPSPHSSPTLPASHSHSTSLPPLPLLPLGPEAGSPAPSLPPMMLMMPTIGPHHPSITSAPPPFASHYGPPPLPYPCPASTDSSLPCHCPPPLSYTALRSFSMGTPPWGLCPSSFSSAQPSSLVEAPSTRSASSQTTTRGAKTSESADRRLDQQQQPQRAERRPPQYNHQRHTSYTPTVVAGANGPTVHLQATPTATSSAFGHLTAPVQNQHNHATHLPALYTSPSAQSSVSPSPTLSSSTPASSSAKSSPVREIKFRYHMSLSPSMRPLDSSTQLNPGESKKRTRSRITGRKCAHCGSQKTSEWRMGPEGRGTLCNACGLRYRKKLKANLPPKAASSSASSSAPNPISLLLNSDQQPNTSEVDD